MLSDTHLATGFFDVADFGNRLGYAGPEAQDRRKEIKANMRALKQWLDHDEIPALKGQKAGACSSLRPRMDSMMQQPVRLIASTGRIHKAEKEVNHSQTKPLTLSDNTKHVGPVQYEPRPVNSRPDGFESFPRLALPLPPPLEEEAAEKCMRFVVKKQANRSQPNGVVQKLKQLFKGG